MAAALVGGAAVGAVFGELVKAVLEMKDKALMFKPTLENMITTLDLITPVIKEIGQHNNELGRPREELEYLIRKMDEGTKLVYKCSKISKFNLTARIRHLEQLGELDGSLVRFFTVNMQAQISRDVKETLLKVNRIHSAVNKRSRSFVRADSASGEADSSQIEMHDSSATQPADEDAVETNSTEEAIDHPEILLSLGADAVPVHVNELEAPESTSAHPDIEEVGTNSVEQVMEDIISPSQKVSQVAMPTAAESWFRSLWKTPWKGGANSENVGIGVLAFEVASLMSKIVNLWQSLSDVQVVRLFDEITNSVGIEKLVSVSDYENFIVRSISLEMLENMAYVAESVARLGNKCDSSLKGFDYSFYQFIKYGVDPYKWEFTSKKMDKEVKRMEKFISTDAILYQEMEVLNDLEQTLWRMKAYGESGGANVVDYQKKVAWKKQEVKNLKDYSLWNRTYGYAVLLLARSLFTIFSRINKVFGIQEIIDARSHDSQSASELLQPSFAVKPGTSVRINKGGIFRSGPVNNFRPVSSYICELKPPSDSLGAASLSLHYAHVIIMIEKMAASSYMIGPDARDDLYNMLPRHVRDALRAKLKPLTKAMTLTSLADEWTEAMTRILEWLAPLAHNMLRWLSERSYEQHSFVSRTNVLLVQTLYFANQERTEEAVTELLFGLNYVWRHVRDTDAKTLVECGSSRGENKYPQLNG